MNYPYSSSLKIVRAAGASLLLVMMGVSGATGCGKGAGKIPGLEHFSAQILEQSLSVSFVSTTLLTDAGITLPIPGLDGAIVGLGPDLQSNGTLFQFSIPLKSLLKSDGSLPVTGLPDGRPLPGIIKGVLPRWDFMADRTRVSLYLSQDAFGLFVPLTFLDHTGATLPMTISVPIRDERGNLLGKAFALPPSLSGAGSGIFVLIPAPGSSAPAQAKTLH